MKYILVEILSRDVTFSEKAQTFYQELIDRALHDNVKKYLNKTFKNYLIENYKVTRKTKALPNDPSWMKKKIEQGDEVFILENFSDEDKRNFIHYVDYLNTLDENKLININPKDLPKKVLAWDKQRQKELENQEIDDSGTVVVRTYKNGFAWKKLISENALRYEGKKMNHCVGGYYEKVKNGICTIYSLRDKFNKPHITIEILQRNHELGQIRGNSDQVPHQKYTKYLQNFLEKKVEDFHYDKNKIHNCGYIYLNKILYNIAELPNDITIDTNLNFSLSRNNEIKLPKNLTVNGNLTLRNTKIDKLPSGLTVKGDLDISSTEIKELPDDLSVSGDMICDNTKIEELPNININGRIKISNTKIRKLKDNLTLDYLDISNTSIAELPKGLKINGCLDASNTNITELPDDIQVLGDIDLRHTKLNKIKDNFKINGTLDISNTSISKLPKGLEVGAFLDISSTNITKLPDDIHVDRLSMNNTKIKRLPDNINLIDLRSSNSALEDISNIKVSGILDISYTNITKLPDNLTLDSLNLAYTKIVKLPKNLKLHTLLLYNSIVSEIGEGLTTNVIYGLRESKIEYLPANMTVNEDLDLSKSKIKEIPENLTVMGDLNISYTSIKEIPKSLKLKGNLISDDISKVKILKTAMEFIKDNPNKDIMDLLHMGAPLFGKAIKYKKIDNKQIKSLVTSNTRDDEIGQTIYKQLGGNKFRVMTGSKDFFAIKNGLRMSLAKNKSGANRLDITLNGHDLYDLKFYSSRFNMKTASNTIKVKKEYKDIYFDQLQEIFTHVTGLYTHL